MRVISLLGRHYDLWNIDNKTKNNIMNLLAPVSTIMTKDLIVLPPSATMAEAGEIFRQHRIHHIPVVYAGELVGILSKTDYLHFEFPHVENDEEKKREEARMNNVKVNEHMTKGIAKVDPTTRINVVLELFKENIFHAIPVVDHARLVGIISPLDVIKHLDADQSATAEY